MVRSLRGCLCAALAAVVGAAGQAEAQTLGTFKWQLQPYCNVVTVTITTRGGVFALDGVDDQCGGQTLAAAAGTAFFNPDGSVGLGFTIVPVPSGLAATVAANINPTTLSGTWRDTTGNSGSFRFAPAGGSGGSPRPTGPSLSGAVVGYGLNYSPNATGGPRLDVNASAILAITGVKVPGYNLGLGSDALQGPHNDAYNNTALGNGALRRLTSGDFNTAVGHDAAPNITDGGSNVAVGGFAMRANISGSQNVGVGTGALERIRISNGNTAIGSGALFQLELGINNIAIGERTGLGLVAGSHNIYLGASGVNLDNYTTRLGSGAQQRAFIGGIRGVQTGIANAVPVVIDSSGQLGTVNSSRRFKEDIQDLDVADKVLDLRPVQFRYTTAFADGAKPWQDGLVAEEVEAVLPELVSRSQDGEIETVHYHVLPTLLLAQVQRLERERRMLADWLGALEREVGQLRTAAGGSK